jgi:Family of unknown function (DUF6516)
LLIEEYFQVIQSLIDNCSKIQSTVNYDKRSSTRGFIRAQIEFEDGSVLNVREFVNVVESVDRMMYAYQYMDATNQLIFRYDNTEHHKKLNLPTFPHHKHDGDEQTVIASSAPTLAEVLTEIIERMRQR